jgi:Kef-type K+ transport system membrane component KefB
VLGVIPAIGPVADVVTVLAELGVILLLFQIGLETNPSEMFRVGPASIAVATVGVVLPFVFGFLYWTSVPHGIDDPATLGTSAVFIGAALCATSVGITARVLRDLGQLQSIEGRIIVGAAVVDDVLGLVILSVVSAFAAGQAVTAPGVARILAVAIGFLVIAIAVGGRAAPPIFRALSRMRGQQMVLVGAVTLCFALAALADLAGSALIIGAFAAGVVLSGTEQFHEIEDRARPVGAFLTPIFFVSVGSALDVRLLDPTRPGGPAFLAVVGGLTLLAILGKLAAGWAAPWVRFRRLAVGVGMVPRGEVGLIFADVGRRSGLLGTDGYGIVLLMVMLTTFVAPPLLKRLFPAGAPPEGTE